MALTCGIDQNVSFDFTNSSGKTIKLLGLQLDPSNPKKFHLKLLKIIFTLDELKIGLIEKTSSDRPLFNETKINLLNGKQ